MFAPHHTTFISCMLSFLLVLLAFAYAGLIASTVQAWQRMPVTPPAPAVPLFFSIVIPARNEALRIGGCLQSILDGSYPAHLYEIIVVDDHSDDHTAHVVERYATRGVRLIHPQNALEGKKNALLSGIQQAHGAWVVTTDADCSLPEHWLALLSAATQSIGVVAVAGPVLFSPTHNLLERFQALDFIGMMLVTGAGIGSGKLHLGNGAHLAFSKRAFEQVGGYAGNTQYAGGDDVFLLQKLGAAFPGGIRFLKNKDAAVWTPPTTTWSDFLQQRLRWGTKNAALPQWRAKYTALVVWSYCWSLLLVPVLAFGYPHYTTLALVLWLVKLVADYYLLAAGCRFFGQQRLMRSFLASQVLHVVYIAGVGTAGLLVRKYWWKGRKVR